MDYILKCVYNTTFDIAVVLNEATTCNGGDCRQPLLHKIQTLLQGNQIQCGMGFPAYMQTVAAESIILMLISEGLKFFYDVGL